MILCSLSRPTLGGTVTVTVSLGDWMQTTVQAMIAANPAKEGSDKKPVKPKGPKNWTEGEIQYEIIKELKTKFRFARDAGWTLYYYLNGFQWDGKNDTNVPTGFYAPAGRELVDSYAIMLMRKWEIPFRWKPGFSEHVVKFLLHDPGVAPKLPDKPPLHLLNVRNGMLDLRTRELLPHSPEFYSYVQLPVSYDPEARCPNWDEFIKDVFEEDCWDLAWEISGWLLRPDKRIQKAVVLLGSGANGKSTFLDGVRNLIGGRNISSCSIQYLQQNRFATHNLIGKLANICADLPTKELEQSDVFKALTGDDPIRVEPKFQRGFDIDCFARLLFSANNPPVSKEGGAAYYRRWVLVPFNREFTANSPGFKSRDEIQSLLFTEREMSGFLNRALEGMTRLDARKDFSNPPSVLEALKQFQSETDPLHLWMESQLDTKAPEDARSPQKEIHSAYNQWRARGGRKLPPIASSIFWRELRKALGRELKTQRFGPRGEQEWWVFGLRLKNPSNLLEVVNE